MSVQRTFSIGDDETSPNTKAAQEPKSPPSTPPPVSTDHSDDHGGGGGAGEDGGRGAAGDGEPGGGEPGGGEPGGGGDHGGGDHGGGAGGGGRGLRGEHGGDGGEHGGDVGDVGDGGRGGGGDGRPGGGGGAGGGGGGVLVVGGGLVGLVLGLLLRHHGIQVGVVERRTGTSPQPKARRLHVRSLEIFREMGLAGRVHDAAAGLAGYQHMAFGPSLAEAQRLPVFPASSAAPDDPRVMSPEPAALISQDELEPLLRGWAVEAGADVRFGVGLERFTQDADGVTAYLSDGTTRRAAYLVAADGARSSVREALGIRRRGRGALAEPNVNVYFKADLGDVVRDREFNLCRLTNPAAPGALASVDGRYRWVFMTPLAQGRTRSWEEVLRTALGVPMPDLEVLSVLEWTPEMLVAETFSRNRVFLVGDAAHVMPPYAAAGANTGIADAHNLAWKLAEVLDGRSSPSLISSYDQERRPAGWFAADQSTRRSAQFAPGAPPDPTLAHPFVLAAGAFQYPAGALRGDLTGEPVTTYAPSGRVGTRIPHRWLDAEHTRSTVDLAGPGWAVVTDLDFLGPGEAALLRPDQVVAWRGAPEEALAIRDQIRGSGPAMPAAGSVAAAGGGASGVRSTR